MPPLGGMKKVIITKGPLFDRLEAMSMGKWRTIRLPVARPVAFDKLSGPADSIQPLIEYEEWEPVALPDGGHGWMRRGS